MLLPYKESNVHTVTQSAGSVQFHTALIAASERAKAKFSPASERIEKALALVETDAVTDMTRLRPHWYTVRSQTDRTVWYNVVSNGTTACDCPDYERRGRDNPEYGCKHVYAVLLLRAARRDMPRTVIHPLRHAYVGEPHGEVLARELGEGMAQVYPHGVDKSGFRCPAQHVYWGPEA